MSKIYFILPYLVFMFFVVFASVEWEKAEITAYNPSFLNFTNSSTATGSAITTEAIVSGDISPPVCNIEGFDAMLDVLGCGVSYLGFFVSMAFISSDFLILNILLFLPLGFAFIWAIFEMVRGV